MITKEMLLETYNISPDMFTIARIAWEDLEYIYTDYFDNKYKIYQGILPEFEKDYLGNISDKGIHSYQTRVKDAVIREWGIL